MEQATKIALISLGCAKNLTDSEHMLALIKQAGMEIADRPEDADAVIVNTCGFIESAKEEAVENILDMAELKAAGVIKAIIVTGCLAERYKDELAKELPEADAILGTANYKDIVAVISAVMQGKRVQMFDDCNSAPLGGKRLVSTPFYSAYLKIAEGCNNHCAFCVIPSLRGKYRSRPFEDIVDEAEELAKSGVKELIVIAQDTSKYGADLYGKVRLGELLQRLCDIDGIKWVRVHYLYPDKVDDELLEVFAKNDKLADYFDIPIQHINSRLLRSMNRRGDKEYITELFGKIRAKLPDAVIRTSLIVGLPGETEEEFNELCEFLREARLPRVGVFTFSPEEGTKAAEMDCQVDEDVKSRRKEIIEQLQLEIMDEFAEKFVGRSIDVLVEGYDEEEQMYFGRSYGDSPDIDGTVWFESERGCDAGEFVKVKINSFDGADLIGSICE